MDRRALLKTGLAGGSALGLGGCAHVPPHPENAADPLGSIDAADVDRHLAHIDQRLAWIDGQAAPDIFPRQTYTPEQQPEADRVDRLFRKSTRCLYLTGCFLEASDEIKAHPGMQARIAAAQGDMDEAVFGTTAMLEAMTPEDHRRLGRTLKERPELAENLAKMLDAPAKEDGLPLKRRYVLRAGILELADRMKAQSPATIIDPYLQKVRRIEARGPEAASASTSRLLAARIGEEAFWEHQEKMSKLAAAWERRLAQVAPATASPTAVAPAPVQTSAPPQAASPTQPHSPPANGPNSPSPPPAPPVKNWERPAAQPRPPAPKAGPTAGHRTLSMGGHIMGFGAASVGVGLIFAGLAQIPHLGSLLVPAVIFGVTIGPILLVIGLIVVIVGAIVLATE